MGEICVMAQGKLSVDYSDFLMALGKDSMKGRELEIPFTFMLDSYSLKSI